MLQEELYKIYLKSPNNLFDEFISECQKWYDMPAHSFSEMRMRDNKKIRGDIFEEFCVLYLKYVKKYKNVWLLKDVPDEILKKIHVARRDMGIDIIVETATDTYIAVQCKYKKHVCNVLSWKALSTFYALCLRTGPWEKYIIMTNCTYTRHQGKKTKQDVSYCLKTLQNITRDEWLAMCNVTGEKLGLYERQVRPEAGDEDRKEEEDIIIVEEKKEAVVVKAKQPTKKTSSSSIPKKATPTKEELRAIRASFYGVKELSERGEQGKEDSSLRSPQPF